MRGYFPTEASQSALLRLKVRGTQAEAVLTMAIDTGAAPALMLPRSWADHLGIIARPGLVVTLADGSLCRASVGTCDVEWFNKSWPVEVVVWPEPAAPAVSMAVPKISRPNRPDGLVGQSLLSNCELRINYVSRDVILTTPG